jgi:glycosyltransferase involved in cell wall biosynthesis
MEVLDLANLHVLDRLLLVSEYMRTTLRSTIGAFNAPLAERVDARAAVVGLPLAVERIDACNTGRRFSRPTVVFNHAPVSSKNPELFARVMARLLPHHDVAVLITRDFPPGQPGSEAIADLAARFPEQVILGRDMPLDEYYEALWAADLQVSTATHESLGVSTLEAMYTGNACVLPRLGSYPEICDGHPDVLYELGEGPLEERLLSFLEHPERRRAVASELQRMAARYSPGAVVQRISEEVLAVARGGPCTDATPLGTPVHSPQLEAEAPGRDRVNTSPS